MGKKSKRKNRFLYYTYCDDKEKNWLFDTAMNSVTSTDSKRNYLKWLTMFPVEKQRSITNRYTWTHHYKEHIKMFYEEDAMTELPKQQTFVNMQRYIRKVIKEVNQHTIHPNT